MLNDIEDVIIDKPAQRSKPQACPINYAVLEGLIYDTPDINHALVARLKKLIAQGKYEISDNTIANRLLARLHP